MNFLVPVGFTFVQLPNEPNPAVLWPNLIWAEVTEEYAGLFFRAEGGSSAGFGTVQAESSNRLTDVEFYGPVVGESFPRSISVPATNAFSDYIISDYASQDAFGISGQRFRNSGSETRPRNTAIRIWRRL